MTSSDGPQLEVLADPQALSRRAAEWLTQIALATPGRLAIALSGGETPRGLYQDLAGAAFVGRFPWSRVHWFWGDERFVPPRDPRSNYRMAQEAMLSHAPIPPANIHPIPTLGLDPDAAASAYQNCLQSFYGAPRLDPTRALFDVTLLGLGDDGHTASLFPGTAVLQERTRWVAPVVGAKADTRITLTYPALEASRWTVMLVSGEAKQAVFARLRAGDSSLPAARLCPHGEILWFADQAAMGVEH